MVSGEGLVAWGKGGKMEGGDGGKGWGWKSSFHSFNSFVHLFACIRSSIIAS